MTRIASTLFISSVMLRLIGLKSPATPCDRPYRNNGFTFRIRVWFDLGLKSCSLCRERHRYYCSRTTMPTIRHYSPHCARLVTTHIHMTRYVRHVNPMHLAVSSLSNARLDAFDTSNVSCRVETCRAKWNLGLFLYHVESPGDFHSPAWRRCRRVPVVFGRIR